MDPPTPPPAAAPPVSTAFQSHVNYPDSLDSSPRSRNADTWDEPLGPTSADTSAAKLRLMCSYGGHIVPRPHDKSLCYIGGDTRIVVVDRHTSLTDLSTRLSKTLLDGRPFSLKYQLPNEDLDSLISVTTDEDLDNMIEEYDRMGNSSSNPSAKPSRIRLFLFPLNPESTQSMGPILDSSGKSEDWFLNALNSAGLLNSGFSDSASVNCLLGLDDDVVGKCGNNTNNNSNSNLSVGKDGEISISQSGSFGNGNKNWKQGQDIHSVPDSPMLETTSSFGSTSSSPSLANLPPIRVHVEDGVSGGGIRVVQDQRVGIEEQFAQLGVGGQKQDHENFVVLSSPPPIPPATFVAGAVGSTVPVSSSGGLIGEYMNRVVSDDERSDHGVQVGYRKQQSLPQSQPQSGNPQASQQKSSGVVDLPSPDSVSSDSSMSNPMTRSKPLIYQDPVVQIPSANSRLPGNNNQVDPKVNLSDPNVRVHNIQQQVQESAYIIQHQFDPQQQSQPHQFIHSNTQYIHQHQPGTVPISSYYPVYPSQQHHHPHQLEQQYPVYYVSARPTQAYHNVPMPQSNVNEATSAVPPNRPQTPPNPTMVAPSGAYNHVRNAPMSKPEMTSGGVYRQGTTSASPLVQVPTNQHQQQYVGYSQGYSRIHHPSQQQVPTNQHPTFAAAANYGYEFSDQAHAQIYYTQPLAPSQYQTMAAAQVVSPETSAQHPTDSIKQQQMRTSQPL